MMNAFRTFFDKNQIDDLKQLMNESDKYKKS